MESMSKSLLKCNKGTFKKRSKERLAGHMSRREFELQRCKSNSKLDVTKSKVGHDTESSWVAKAGFSLVPMDLDQGSINSGPPELYVRIGTRVSSDCKSTWYLVPAEDLEIEPQPPHPKPNFMKKMKPPLSVFGQMPGNIPMNSVAVALPPQIYVLGGGFGFPSAQVFSYDITSPHKGWERRPDMICRRWPVSALALDGKIYVFGGMSEEDRFSDSTLPYAEVYDPESDRWEALSADASTRHAMNAPVNSSRALFMDQYLNKHLLVHTRCAFYTFDISVDSFTLREKVPFKYHGSRGAVIDGVVYSYDSLRKDIIAYDLRAGKWYRDPVRGLDEGTVLPYGSGSPFLSHIGNGRLCITFGNSVRCADSAYSTLLLTCSVVRVRKTSPSDGGVATLHASLESFKRYIIPGDAVQDCLVL